MDSVELMFARPTYAFDMLRNNSFCTCPPAYIHTTIRVKIDHQLIISGCSPMQHVASWCMAVV